MNELNKKLHNWAGVLEKCEICGGIGKVDCNVGEHRPPYMVDCICGNGWVCNYDFPKGFNACFERLEPPLYERFGIYHIGFARVKGVGYNCYMNRAAVEYPHREEGRSKELMTLGQGKTLGESFCDAALKVINRYPELEKGIIEQLMEKK